MPCPGCGGNKVTKDTAEYNIGEPDQRQTGRTAMIENMIGTASVALSEARDNPISFLRAVSMIDRAMIMAHGDDLLVGMLTKVVVNLRKGVAPQFDEIFTHLGTARASQICGPTRVSCIECVEKHLGSAMVQIAETRDGYAHRLRAIGHLHEAEDESQEYPELHAAIRAARKAYQRGGLPPNIMELASLTNAVIDKINPDVSYVKV